ncbi:uncharacterized protein LOC111048664 isoform X2 [Nilaparvata lugens]|uniref:uncharacterized protein LOC111048664 isoform X2 n=1 Tax=Nilaparvata lugens TaxID=108931 RepID=UPI00193DC84B|nr:uncharacterized protein LOC111048664 isoform X2 [Nilaparvata lugens]
MKSLSLCIFVVAVTVSSGTPTMMLDGTVKRAAAYKQQGPPITTIMPVEAMDKQQGGKQQGPPITTIMPVDGPVKRAAAYKQQGHQSQLLCQLKQWISNKEVNSRDHQSQLLCQLMDQSNVLQHTSNKGHQSQLLCQLKQWISNKEVNSRDHQ